MIVIDYTSAVAPIVFVPNMDKDLYYSTAPKTVSLEFYNEIDETTITVSSSASLSSYYYGCVIDPQTELLLNDNYYILTIKYLGAEVYKTKAFVTNLVSLEGSLSDDFDETESGETFKTLDNL